MSESIKIQGIKDNDSQGNGSGSESENNGSNNKMGNVRPMGNRFPQDPKLASALQYHKEKWEKTVLPVLAGSLGIRIVDLGRSIS